MTIITALFAFTLHHVLPIWVSTRTLNRTVKTYDFIMAGGGMSALSLAYFLTREQPGATIAIVDPEEKGENDRTWSYWAKDPQPFDHIATQRWSRIRFASNEWSSAIELDPYRYFMIRSEDFYDTVLAQLEHAHVDFFRDRVVDIDGSGDSARVEGENGAWNGSWVFDSRFDPEEYANRSGPHHYLKQHFLGWTIETDENEFDPSIATLFDFRVPDSGEFRFGYILPQSANRALVEFTLFTANLLEKDEYVSQIENYIQNVLEIRTYRVVEQENGVIPMTDEPAVRKAQNRVLNIGTRGGLVKASTGYAFARTQRDSIAIATSMVRFGHPFAIPEHSRCFRLLDTMMLQVMHRRGQISDHVFANLFRKNPIDRLFRFLEEQTTFAETLAVMATVPWPPFIGAFFRTKLFGRI